MYGNRTGKLRVRVYPRVGSGMGRNFRRGSGTGIASSATGTGRVAEMVDPHTPSIEATVCAFVKSSLVCFALFIARCS